MKNQITITDLKKQQATKVDELMNNCKLFWAFSDEQFMANKTELKEGEKYVSFGVGGYMPKGYVNNWIEGMKAINKWYKKEIKQNKEQQEAHILYELNNYEAFYTSSIEDAFNVLKEFYTAKQVWTVFNKHKDLKEC